MQLKKWQWAVFAVIAYCVFLIVYMPATIATNIIQKQIPDLQLADVNGTLWSGEARSAQFQGYTLHKLKWQLSPAHLLLLRGKLDINAGNARKEQIYMRASTTVSLFDAQNVELDNSQVYLPASMIMAKLALPIPVSAQGKFTLNIEHFEFAQGCIELDAKGAWINGQVKGLQGPINLGNFNADLRCNNNAFEVQVAPDNSLSLDATVSLDMSGKYAVSGRFKVDENLPDEVHQAAAFFGRPDQQGYTTLNL